MTAYTALSRLDLTVRPFDDWLDPPETTERTPTPFEASLSSTVETLVRELKQLDASQVVLRLAIAESAIRTDGLPYANATCRHPGVILAFDSKHGPLRYACDTFRNRGYLRDDPSTEWTQNLRAIALGLEALRKVDRYGISKSGEQYRGYAELPSGIPMSGPTHMTTSEALKLIIDATRDHKGVPRWEPDELRGDAERIGRAYKLAATRLHPDAPAGTTEDFQRLQVARDLLLREAS